MPIGYLITAVLLGACTLAALWPLRSQSAVGTVVYLVGMTFNELPVLALLAAVAATLLAVAQGDLATPLGVASAVLMAVVAAGLLLVVWRAVRSRDVPERALDDALGTQWRADIAPHLAAGLQTSPAIVRGLLLPLLRRRPDVRRVRDLNYGDGSRHNRLDLFLPRRRPADGPVLVHFHGGRFVSGAKNRESLYLLHRLAARGWTCVSANYHLAPTARFPDYVVDAKRVLAWVREQGPSYGAGRGPVFVAGNSAGGYLAAFAALTPGRQDLQPGFEDADTSVSGAICLYGYYGRTVHDDPDSTPAAHMHPDAPPFYLLHGHRDTVVPVEWGRAFAYALAATSRQPVVWSEMPDAQHSFDFFASLRARLVADRIEAFTAWVRSHEARVPW
jgi:acetyl esterase/lipase